MIEFTIKQSYIFVVQKQKQSEMASEEDQTASFMMYRLWRFPSSLCIPRKFVSKYREVGNQAWMMLESSDDSGRCWKVKIKKMDGGDYHMEDGWPEFVRDNHIDDTDFLTFRLLNRTTFKVVIYSSDGCARSRTALTSPTTTTSGPDENENERKKREGTPNLKRKRWSGNPLYFEILLKQYHQSRIHLPKKFRDAAHMQETRRVRLEFVGSSRHHHCQTHVGVDHQSRYRVDLARGWSQFREANRLVFGKTYSFQFNPNENVIYVKEVK